MNKREGVVISYAKLNVGLIVLDKREDGFHNIESYFQLISLSDTISYCIEKADLYSLSINRSYDYLDGKEDLMEKAGRIFYEKTGLGFDLSINIEKNIPTKSGLGGGSSNAASVLNLLYDLYQNQVDKNLMMDIAKSVGSDVPFFLSLYNAAFVTGLGENIKKVHSLEYPYAVLIFPKNIKVDTKKAYSLIDEEVKKEKHLPDQLDGEILREKFINDFERVTDYKDLPKTLKEIAEGRFYSLSGSGSTWYILLNNYEEAYPIVNKLRKKDLDGAVVKIL